MKIASVGRAFPKHYYPQEVLAEALRSHWAERHHNIERLERLHQNVLVGGRHLALPLERYEQLANFRESNDAFIECAVDIGSEAIQEGLASAGLTTQDVDHLFFVATTGIATPSVDALILNQLSFRSDVKRTPIFGLGCAGGAVGITRASDYLRAYPEGVAVLLSVELCSLTLQRKDLSVPNIIASGLFGDGAAACVLVGAKQGISQMEGPRVIATRSVFYPDTKGIMGWDITEDGFAVVLSAELPNLVRRVIRGNVESFLEDQGVELSQIEAYVCHPGGPRILEALQEALEIPPESLELTWASLKREGNLSSASVLMVLGDTLREKKLSAGSYGLLLAMGPGFCSELVLLQW